MQAINADLAEDLKRNGLTTLLDLVVKADLAETLADVEPATIFAPTNAAFESVPRDVLNSLLDNKQCEIPKSRHTTVVTGRRLSSLRNISRALILEFS